MNIDQIKSDVEQVTLELLNAAELKPGDDIVIGGSSSEIMGKHLGSETNIEVARVVIKSMVDILKANNIYPVVQACEHINRCLVVEEQYAIKNNLVIVNVIPIEAAGGGFATAAMEILENPVVVEHVKVKAGIDIGDVFIGMHLKDVGVVVRSDIKTIGEAQLSMIRTRPKLIGGSRAIYK